MRLPIAISITLMMACSKQAEPTPPRPEPAKPAPGAAVAGNSELENKGVAMMQRMADMFAADAKDCDKLAVDIKAFIVENKELLGQLTELERSQSDQEKAAFEARNKPVQDQLMQKMDPTMQACAQNPQVQAAMKEFPTE
jgi:uncharacterized lipoprotein YajG